MRYRGSVALSFASHCAILTDVFIYFLSHLERERTQTRGQQTESSHEERPDEKKERVEAQLNCIYKICETFVFMIAEGNLKDPRSGS